MSKHQIKIVSVLFFLIVSCNMQNKSTELKYFPVDDLNGIITKSGIQLDKSGVEVSIFFETLVMKDTDLSS